MHWGKQPPGELLPNWGSRWGEADLMEGEWVSSSRGTVMVLPRVGMLLATI